MDLSKYAPHVVQAFHSFAEARVKEAFEQGRAAGRDEVMAGLKALSSFLPGGVQSQFQALPPVATVAPLHLSQPAGSPVETDNPDDFDIDDLVEQLAGESDQQVRQQLLAVMWAAVVEAYQARGEDPEPVLAKLKEMTEGGAGEAATGGDEAVWMAWVGVQTKSGKTKAVWDDEGGLTRKPLYGQAAERALATQKKRGHSSYEANRRKTEARARRNDLVKKIDSGELFDEQDWDDFSGHLQSLPGKELADLRKKMLGELMVSSRKGVLKRGKSVADLRESMKSGVARLIQHAIEQADLPEPGPSRKSGHISHMVGQMGGLRPHDDEFARQFGFHPIDAMNKEKILPKGSVHKNGRRFSDLAEEFRTEGHVYPQEGQTDEEALHEAISGGRKSAQIDTGAEQDERMRRQSVSERLKLARLKRTDPDEYERRKKAILGGGEPEVEGGGDYPADWDEVGRQAEPESTGQTDPDEYADYLADGQQTEGEPVESDAADTMPVSTTPEPVAQEPEPVVEPQAEEQPAEKPVLAMTEDDRKAALAKLIEEQMADRKADGGGKKKKVKPAAQASPETPPAPVKSASVPPADPVPARTEAVKPEDAESEEEFEARLKREAAERRANFKDRRAKLLADPKFAVNLDDGEKPRSEKTIERPKDRPLTEAEQERVAREKIDANIAPDGEDGPTVADLKAAEGEADAAVKDASGEYVDPTKPVVGKAGKTASERAKRIAAMQAKVASGKGLAGEDLSDEDREELADTDAEEQLAEDQTKQAAKGKAGRKRLADNTSAPFANCLTTNKGGGRELAQKAAKVFTARGVVPPVPKSVRDAFANAPDKDKLDAMWESHVKQLASGG